MSDGLKCKQCGSPATHGAARDAVIDEVGKALQAQKLDVNRRLRRLRRRYLIFKIRRYLRVKRLRISMFCTGTLITLLGGSR